MNGHTKKIYILLTLALFAFLPSARIHAQNATREYTTLVPLPHTTDCVNVESSSFGSGEDKKSCKTTLAKYLPAVFNLSIGVAAVLAFLVISYGGFTYMTTDAVFKKEEGRKHIENALYGLGLVIGAYILLYTINPQILNFDLNVVKPELKNLPAGVIAVNPLGGDSAGSNGNVKPGYSMTDAQKADSLATKNKLYNDSGGQINTQNGPCTNGGTKGCTNLNDLPVAAVMGVETLQKVCKTAIVITGGTEGGHVTHGQNDPVLDLGYGNTALDNCITSHSTKTVQTKLGPVYYVNINGSAGAYLRESNPPHWHVIYN